MMFQEQTLRRRFATTALLILAGFFIWINATTTGVPMESRLWAGLIFGLAAFPAIRWAMKVGQGYPAFQVLNLALIPTESLPLLTKTVELQTFPAETIRTAALAVVAFQLSLMFAYSQIRAEVKNRPFWTEPVVGQNIPRLLSTTLSLATLYTLVSTFFYPPPAGLDGPLRAISSGLSVVSAYTLSNYLSGGELPRNLRPLLVINITVQALTFASSLIMVQGITLVVTAVLGYLSRAKRVPWFALAVVIGAVALLHTGKSAMREKYWEGDRRGSTVKFTDLPAFYSEWINTSIAESRRGEDEPDAVRKRDTNKLLQRSSLFHMLCLVVDNSPERQPHLLGKTYADLPAQFVPRFFWPDKPQVHVSTSMLGIYYGLQDEEATKTTTIGFGFLAEAWANFGFGGCIALGLLFGGIHKMLWEWTRESELFSPAGILMITFTAWSFETGQTLSVWTSSFYQAAVVLIASTVAIKQFFHG